MVKLELQNETTAYFLSELATSDLPSHVLNSLSGDGFFLGHGDSVVYNDKAIIISGCSGAGKSTISERFQNEEEAIPFSEDFTWIYSPKIGQPVVFNGNYKGNGDLLTAPLGYIIELNLPEINRNWKYMTGPDVANEVLRIFTLSVRNEGEISKANLDSLALSLSEEQILRYNSGEENEFDTYRSIKKYIDNQE